MSTGSLPLAQYLGVNVAGFLRGGLGLGQAARLYVAALVDAGVPHVEGAHLKTTDFADLQRADATAALQVLDDGTLPGAFVAQVVEHLGHEQLGELLSLLDVKPAPGGVVVLETVNPHSPPALKAFWTDPTHHHPLFPEVLLALCRLAGFDAGEVILPGASGFDRDVYTCRDYAVVAPTAENGQPASS